MLPILSESDVPMPMDVHSNNAKVMKMWFPHVSKGSLTIDSGS